jgi:hypothetical protein
MVVTGDPEPDGGQRRRVARPEARRGDGSVSGAALADAVGTVRRLDHGPRPDRHPAAVTWPDDRRPRPRRVEDVPPLGLPSPPAPRIDSRPPRIDSRPQRIDSRAYGYVGYVDEDEAGSAEDADASWHDPGGVRDSRSSRQGLEGVEANARLTGTTAAVIFVLLAIEGLTILRIFPLLSVHVFVGMLLVPPVLLKIGSTTWRFARYYMGDPAYRRKGPPAPALRLIGPVVIVLTLTVLASGIALLLAPLSMRSSLLLLHQASFVVWIMVMAVHVLGHILDTAKLAPRDWYHRTRRQVKGATTRQWLVASSVAVGLVLGAVMVPKVGPWLAALHHALG